MWEEGGGGRGGGGELQEPLKVVIVVVAIFRQEASSRHRRVGDIGGLDIKGCIVSSARHRGSRNWRVQTQHDYRGPRDFINICTALSCFISTSRAAEF